MALLAASCYKACSYQRYFAICIDDGVNTCWRAPENRVWAVYCVTSADVRSRATDAAVG
jgi:hypothetical protein